MLALKFNGANDTNLFSAQAMKRQIVRGGATGKKKNYYMLPNPNTITL